MKEVIVPEESDVPAPFMGSPRCSDEYCASIRDKVDSICHSQGGGLVYVPTAPNANTWCWCKCSCVAAHTPIRVDSNSTEEISKLKAGDKVLSLFENGDWRPTPVIRNSGTGTATNDNPAMAIFLELTNGSRLVVSLLHLFLMPDRSLKRADRLAPSDQLLGADGKPKPIAKLEIGRYDGAMWNLTLTADGATTTPWGHLIDTNGVVSGDLALEYPDPKAFEELPLVGSAEWFAAHGDAAVKATTLEEKVLLNTEDSAGNTFTPFPRYRVPDDFAAFQPAEDSDAAPGMLALIDAQTELEMAEYLIQQYRLHYPSITYQIDWLNDDVNAIAFIQGGRRYVRLYGGLIRHRYMELEGIGLVLSHEIGHHYAGDPKYPNSWASCEGQSDYWGALIAQRKVWWGEYAIEQTLKGAEQVYRMFLYGLVLSGKKQASSCSHPPAGCRRDAYIAGCRAEPKPACAG
jgi:hypothetical protein